MITMDPMDISKEDETPTTDRISKDSPSPQITTTSPPPPNPTTPPPPSPQDLEPQNISVANRQLLKPVPPSKRAFSEAPQTPSSEIVENTLSYLPREFTDIIAIRDRRERAWHARLMICTSAISCIESTLAGFEDEIEKEEACAFQTYFRQAIARFAASDSAPPPPPIPAHS